MTRRRAMAALLLACAVAFAPPARPQAAAGGTHEVRRGDTLFAIARKARHDGMSRNQTILAIVRANPNVFGAGNIHLLEVGTVLVIPSRGAVAAIEPSDADRQVREMLARPPASQIAAIKPAAPVPAPRPSAVPALGREEAARRYREGLALERKGDAHGALKAYLEAGEAGDGLAQRRLGQIYDKGSVAARRDYQASLRWYQKAREQGVDIDRPQPRMTTK